MAFPVDAIAEDFKVFWDVPIRAYTGTPLFWRLSYYEKENRQIFWTIANAPTGMTVGINGTINWTNPVAGTYSGIQVTATRLHRDLVNYPTSPLAITTTFNLVVNTTSFYFVATTGNDANVGTLASPFLTLEHALSVVSSGGVGKTIFLRVGNYTPSLSAEMFAGINFTQSAYAHISNYNREAVTVRPSNWGLRTETSSYVLISGLDVANAIQDESGQIDVRNLSIVKDCVTHGSAWTGNDNTAGLLVRGTGNVINRVVSYNNIGASGNVNNMSNFLVYNEVAGVNWMLNTKGYESTFNWKIKHTAADNALLILHNGEGKACGFAGCGKNSSVRYCVVYNSDVGISVGWTDPSAYTTQGMLIEHNTVISSAGAADAYDIIDGYCTTGPVTFNRNILYQSHGQSGAGFDNKKMLQLWQFTTPHAIPRAYPYYADYNCYYNTTNMTDSFIIGKNGGAVPVNFLGYQALTGVGIVRDPHGVSIDPGFTSVGTGDLNLTTSSGVAFINGDYMGAFNPLQHYGTVGGSTTTLLEFDNYGAATPFVLAVDVVSAGTGTAWGNPNNVKIADAVYATVALGISGSSKQLQCTKYVPFIPTNSFPISFQHISGGIKTTVVAHQGEVGLFNGASLGSVGGDDPSSVPTDLYTGGYGSILGSDTAPLTRADVVGTGFGSYLVISGDDAASTTSVDDIQLRIFWGYPPGTVTTDGGLGNNHDWNQTADLLTPPCIFGVTGAITNGALGTNETTIGLVATNYPQLVSGTIKSTDIISSFIVNVWIGRDSVDANMEINVASFYSNGVAIGNQFLPSTITGTNGYGKYLPITVTMRPSEAGLTLHGSDIDSTFGFGFSIKNNSSSSNGYGAIAAMDLGEIYTSSPVTPSGSSTGFIATKLQDERRRRRSC